MCGITGFAGGREGQATLDRMVATLAHRGPDARKGVMIQNVGIGATRLAILDLSPSGNQPMYDESLGVVVALNGEIYNFKELRKELSGKFVFSGGSDTEVILRAYEVYGESVFEKLDGMFAIAIYDKPRQRLLLARDRMGKKPLYWSIQNGVFIFGSELKALRAHPVFHGALNPSSLHRYLRSEYVPTPDTIYNDVSKLPPASYLVYENGAVSIKSFWKPYVAEERRPLGEYISILDKKLEDAVSERLVADVPVGMFLSGGIDSAIIAWYATRQNKSIKTFSIGFKEKSYDETSEARKVAMQLGTEHIERCITPEESLRVLPEIINSLDEPIADSSVIPTYFLSALTREHVKVSLSGDGADELFAGYPTFIADYGADMLGVLPMPIHRLAEGLARMIPIGADYMSLGFKIKKFTEGAFEERPSRHVSWLGSFKRDERLKLLQSDFFKLPSDAEFSDISKLAKESGITDKRQLMLYLYERGYLMDEVLVKLDRMSMAVGLEARAPFLATSVVEFAHALPYRHKVHGLTTKYILKELMKDRLPSDILNRPKHGFAIPLSTWLRGPFKELLLNLLALKRLKRQGIFDEVYVKTLVDNHLSGRANNAKQLWTLMMFQMWFDKWGR